MLSFLIGAAVSGVGAALGASENRKAADKAANAQLQVADKNNALIRDIYNQNVANFQPYSQSGARANALLDSFLHGPQPVQTTQPVGQPMPANDGQIGTIGGPGGFFNDFSVGDSFGGYTATNAMGARNLNVLRGQQMGQQMGQQPTPIAAPQAQPAPTMDGFNTFVNSPFYQFPLSEGFRSMNHRLASGGQLLTGAALRGANALGQNYAFAQGLQPFLGLASDQANRGFGGASALAGVGQNMASQTGANNQNAANALSNAALLRGQANAGLYNSLGSLFGNLASSYKGGF